MRRRAVASLSPQSRLTHLCALCPHAPHPCSLLAESMLPEGAHLRESDWTVSFLTNQMLLQAEEDLRKAQQKAREKEAAAAAAAAASGGAAAATPSPAAVAEGAVTHDLLAVEVETQSQGYLCMLNLVRTKKDSTVARGAVVKALALVTRHRFYQIFKPLLMLSLDQYFDAKTPQDQVRVLANLYHTINNMPLQDMPQISPLQRRLTRATRLRTATNPSAAEFFNVVVKLGGGGGGGGGTAAAATAQPQTPGSGATSPAASSAAPSVTGAVASPSPAPTPVATLPMRIPLCMESDEVLEASLTTLVNRFQEATMDIYTALLAEKRVIFLGYQQPAAICCDCVLSACLLVSPPVVGTIHRAFPYANLTNMDFLNVYAATCNPCHRNQPARCEFGGGTGCVRLLLLLLLRCSASHCMTLCLCFVRSLLTHTHTHATQSGLHRRRDQSDLRAAKHVVGPAVQHHQRDGDIQPCLRRGARGGGGGGAGRWRGRGNGLLLLGRGSPAERCGHARGREWPRPRRRRHQRQGERQGERKR